MNGIMDYWALLNTLVIMFALGLSGAKSFAGAHWPLLRSTLGYNLLIPALALIIIKTMGWFAPETLAAMAMCIAAAGGTSAGAFVTKVKGSPVLAAKLIVLLLGVSLLAVTVFSQLGWVELGTLSLGGLTVYLLTITLLPLFIGRGFHRLHPVMAARWQPWFDRLGSLLVVLLVIALAVRYGREILSGPAEPMIAAALLVFLFVLPPWLEPEPGCRRTLVLVTLIRNLTLVLSILAVLPQSATLMPTVLAFGLFMYLTTAILVWYWRIHPYKEPQTESAQD
ncbi:MAG: hypothetical protein ACOY7J_15365 [Pseudomonadota bacterium]